MSRFFVHSSNDLHCSFNLSKTFLKSVQTLCSNSSKCNRILLQQLKRCRDFCSLIKWFTLQPSFNLSKTVLKKCTDIQLKPYQSVTTVYSNSSKDVEICVHSSNDLHCSFKLIKEIPQNVQILYSNCSKMQQHFTFTPTAPNMLRLAFNHQVH